MSSSALVSYTRLSPNHSGKRTHRIDTITIHHMAGNLSVEACGKLFADPARRGSSNYGVGSDGRIALYVEEKNRAWTSGNAANDHRAVTIEVANSAGAPDWPVSAKAYAALLDLVTDICKRSGIAKLVWGASKSDRVNHRNGCNMTVHQDFAATACPGPYLLSKMPEIAVQVNQRLGAACKAPAASTTLPRTVRVTANELNIRKGPGTSYPVTGSIKDKGVYTIVEESGGWGRLKSGAGWICLDYCRKT